MVYPLILKNSEESGVFFFSDFHYNHDPNWPEPIWAKRGFKSVIEHNTILKQRWNSKITNNDIVFHLGDICFGKDGSKVLDLLFKELNFKELYLMPGNHYSGYKQLFDMSRHGGDKFYREHVWGTENKPVYLIPNYYEIIVNSQPVVLSHYPIKCWNGHAKGSFMIFGHCHGSYNDGLSTTLDKGKMLDVGPESVGEPLNFNEVKAIMDKKTILRESHHDANTSTPFS